MMKNIKIPVILILLLILEGCITKFIPDVYEDQELIVVEGLVTDQPGVNTVKISKSLPFGRKSAAKPVKGCIVRISDDNGNYYTLAESVPGTYSTNPAIFRGEVGRKYTLHIKTNDPSFANYSYTSLPMEMKPVPPIDSVFFEKRVLKEKDEDSPGEEGCQVYLNTFDPDSKCKYYRWSYTETWEFRLPYSVQNRVCWISNNSSEIHIKNTNFLSEDRINRYPLIFISNETDRLKFRYSLLIDQYSLNDDEFSYWEKMKNVSQEVGSLYDVTPGSIPSNIFCIEDPGQKALGYFSVSARSSKRFFIKDNFLGIVNLYGACASDTVPGPASRPIPGLGSTVWVIEDHTDEESPFRVLTETKGCADCTVRGTNVKPDFWK